MCPIDLLPKEVLYQIFFYLNVTDRLNISLVCKKWLNVMNCKCLMKDINVLIDKNNNNIPLLMQTSRCFLNFSFSNIYIDNKYYEFFNHVSCTVEYLSFYNCEIAKELEKFDFMFNNLKVLRAIDCDSWSLFPSLPNLTELYLQGSGVITDEGISILQKSLKHLKTFTLDCFVAYNQKAYKRFYSHESYEMCPSNSILSFPAVFSFISERAKTLKELKFNISITSEALLKISRIENLLLHKIELCHSHNCSSALAELFGNQPCLKVLHLTGLNLKDDVVTALCTLLPDIKELDIYRCIISSDSLNKIFHLKKLRKLKMGPFFMLEQTLKDSLKSVKFLPVDFLDVSRNMAYVSIDLLLAQCPYLVHLDLSYTRATDETVHLISENLIKLEYLSLQRTDITDYGITGDQCLEEDVKEAENWGKNPFHKPLSNLKYLKQLKLNECVNITDAGFIKAICFHYLEYLNLCDCVITESAIQILRLQNPSIRNFIF